MLRCSSAAVNFYDSQVASLKLYVRVQKGAGAQVVFGDVPHGNRPCKASETIQSYSKSLLSWCFICVAVVYGSGA